MVSTDPVDVKTLDLKVPYLNEIFSGDSGLAIGKAIQLYAEDSGDYKIMAYKPAEDSLKIVITKTDAETGEVKKFYENSYLWNSQFNTLVAYECFEGVEEVETVIEDVCTQSINVASKIIQVLVSADIKDSETAGLPKVAECIKSKIIEYTNEETETCLIQVIVQGVEDVTQAIAMKVAQLEAQGYTC